MLRFFPHTGRRWCGVRRCGGATVSLLECLATPSGQTSSRNEGVRRIHLRLISDADFLQDRA